MTYRRVVDAPSPLALIPWPYPGRLIRGSIQVGLTAPLWRRSVNGTYRKEG
jgi:hypothetical protein